MSKADKTKDVKAKGYPKVEETTEEEEGRFNNLLLGDLRKVAATDKGAGEAEESDSQRRSLKQRFLAAASITPSSISSTGPTSRTLTSVAKDEKDREAMRVAFEESGKVMEGPRKILSMDMTAAEFRMSAARERVHVRAQASAVQQEMVEPQA